MTETDTEEPELTRGEAAMQWARTYLTEHGGRAHAQALYQAAQRAGHKTSTLQIARRKCDDVIVVKESRAWVWRLVTEEERQAIALAHSTDLDQYEEARAERLLDPTKPFRIVVTNWPCQGRSRIVTDTLDESAPGGYVRRTSWVHSQPTRCNTQAPTLEEN